MSKKELTRLSRLVEHHELKHLVGFLEGYLGGKLLLRVTDETKSTDSISKDTRASVTTGGIVVPVEVMDTEIGTITFISQSPKYDAVETERILKEMRCYILRAMDKAGILDRLTESIKATLRQKEREADGGTTATSTAGGKTVLPPIEGEYGQYIQNALKYINANYDKEISLKDVAGAIYVSSFYLTHLFSKELGMSFSNYLKSLRMDKCVQLMREGRYNIQEISGLVGFSDSNYFAKVFKKYYGMSPTQYKLLLQ